MKLDFHIHSTFSDGTLTPEEIVSLCIKNDVKKIGITDHWGTKKYSSQFQVVDLQRYIEELVLLRKKYNQVEIYTGIEIDFSQKYGIDPEYYPFNLLNNLDYVLFEHVDTIEEEWGEVNGRSLDYLINIRKYIKIPVGLAHNHFQKNYQNVENEIRKLKENNIFLELCEAEDKGNKVVNKRIFNQMMEIKKNLASFNNLKEMKKTISRKKHAQDDKYYFEHFTQNTWELIKYYNLSISIGSDSHKGDKIGNFPLLKNYIEKYNLKSQIIFGETGQIQR